MKLLLLMLLLAQTPTLRAGDEVRVTWPGSTVAYPGTIDRVGDGKYFVVFRGAVAPDPQWVEATHVQAIPTATATPLTRKVGDRVQVSWSGGWYDATILEVSGNKAKVRYDRYDSSWDEWVGPERLRAGAAAAASRSEPTGRFTCQSFEAGQLHNQGELVLDPGGQYEDLTSKKRGTWRFDAKSRGVRFTGVLDNGAAVIYRPDLRHGALVFSWPDGTTRTCYR